MPITTGTFAEVQASSTVSFGSMATGATTDLATALGPTESKYHNMLLRLHVTTAPTADTEIRLYRQRSDGTNPSPPPSNSYKHKYVGKVTIKANAAGYFYFDPIGNIDPADRFYWYNASSSESVTASLEAAGMEYS